MGSICFLLIGAATAVQFGWQPIPGGGREYIVQVEPQLVDTFRKEGCSSDVPPQLRDIRKIRVVVGDGRLPHQGEMAPQSKAASGATVAKVTKTAKPVVPDNNAAKPAEKAESRLAGIGDVEDPISEASIPKLRPPRAPAARSPVAQATNHGRLLRRSFSTRRRVAAAGAGSGPPRFAVGRRWCVRAAVGAGSVGAFGDEVRESGSADRERRAANAACRAPAFNNPIAAWLFDDSRERNPSPAVDFCGGWRGSNSSHRDGASDFRLQPVARGEHDSLGNGQALVGRVGPAG